MYVGLTWLDATGVALLVSLNWLGCHKDCIACSWCFNISAGLGLEPFAVEAAREAQHQG